MNFFNGYVFDVIVNSIVEGNDIFLKLNFNFI